MSNTSTDGHSRSEGSPVTERRDGTAPRLAYEGVVEVGARSIGGFEAEAVDVSLDGMRLRTAYLPEPGEKLACRFDGYGGEIVVEGEVAWCRPEARGGELGVQFTKLDARGLELLQRMCHPAVEAEAAPEPADPQAAQPGSRVRVHIQGLGSPMRARVRDVARGEVLIGSNLEFLRVGRDVEIEDVEQGASRVAQIEHVAVDIDPETHVPQLVVALVYAPAASAQQACSAPREAAEDELTTAPYQVRDNPPAEQPAAAREITPEPTVIDASPSGEPSAPARAEYEIADRPALGPAAPIVGGSASAVEAGRASERGAEGICTRDPSPSPPAVSAVAVQRVGALARRIGPSLVTAGLSARGVVGKVVAAARRRREAHREARGRAAPVRTTAEPPSGVLRSDGRRLVREQPSLTQPSAEPPIVPLRPARKRAAFGVVLGLLAVVAIYYGASYLSHRGGAATAAAAPGAELSAAAAAPAVPLVGGSPAQSPVATANVPLFGATPLSTTEAVPVPPEPGTGPANGASETDEAPAEAAPKVPLQREWGFGEVHAPRVLRLKFDGKLAGLQGKETATGFTLVVPGRKSVSSAAGLPRRDKRLNEVSVVNYPDRAEIKVSFKGEVPPFVARAKGKRLVIEIGKSGKNKSDAKTTSTKHKSHKKKKRRKKKSHSKHKKKSPHAQATH